MKLMNISGGGALMIESTDKLTGSAGGRWVKLFHVSRCFLVSKLEASDSLLCMMTCKWSRRRVGVGCHVSFRVLRAAGTSPGSPVINNVKTPEVSHSERLPSVHHVHSCSLQQGEGCMFFFFFCFTPLNFYFFSVHERDGCSSSVLPFRISCFAFVFTLS